MRIPRAPMPILLLMAVPLPDSRAHAQDIPEMGAPAVTAFAEGMEAYSRGQNAIAMEHFLKAHEQDGTFYVALFMAGLTASNAGRGEIVDSVWSIVGHNKDRLSPYYRYRFESQLAQRRGDRWGAIAYSRLAVEENPKSKAAYNLAFQLNGVGHAREAKEVLLKLGHEDEPMRSYVSYYTQLANAHRRLGEFDDALRIARLQEERFPRSWTPLFAQARALGAMGRTADLEEVFRAAEARTPGGTNTPGTVMSVAALELAGHGHEEDGRAVMRRAEAWFDAQPTLSSALRNWHAVTLWSLGDWKGAKAEADALVAAEPDDPWFRTVQGMAAARTGNEAGARDAIEWLDLRSETIPTDPSFRGYLEAVLGDEDAAVRSFEEALREGWTYNVYWHVDPALASLRTRPDFQAFLGPQG